MKKYLLALLCFCSVQLFGQSLESDRLALVSIYNATYTGEYFNDIQGWVVPGTPGDNPCGWPGVTCNGERVTSLDLSMNSMNGPLAPEIGNLTALRYLNLQGGGQELFPFIGKIPVELGNLTNLEYLNLEGNDFEARNIAVIGNLTKLKELRMDPLGDYPAEFANLVNLETAMLGAYGPWRFPFLKFPEAVYQWTKIKHLYMAGIVFTTPITSQIQNLRNLETLELGGLSSNIPAEIGKLAKLTRLVIQGINYVGHDIDAIPTELGNLINLEYLELSYSNISGTIPSSFVNLVNLKTLRLDGNALAGNIPAFLGNLTNIQTLSLGQNQFSGFVPVELTNITGMTYLSLFSNQLSGPLPDFSRLPSNFKTHIMRNKFTFAGMEQNISKLEAYAWQADIPMYANGVQVGKTSGTPATLSVDAGGTLSKNTYRWYKDNILTATITGNPNFLAAEDGVYRVEVVNSALPKLTLKSVNYMITILPVTLVSFNGTSKNGQNMLTWNTSSESNNKGFQIERSADARDFQMVGFVDGNADSREAKVYHFTDSDAPATSYYRLKQLDNDGKFEYSRVIVIKADSAELSIYPNPAQDYLTVCGVGQKQQLLIIDKNGRIILKREIVEKEQIGISKLTCGIYTIVIGGQSRSLLISR